MLLTLALLALPAVALLFYAGHTIGRIEGIREERVRSRREIDDIFNRVWQAYERVWIEAGDEAIVRMIGRN